MSENNKHYILPKGKYVVDNFGTVMNVSKDITFPDKKTAFAFLEVQEHDKGRIKINKDYVLSMLKEGEGLKDFVAQEITIKQNNKNLLSLPPGIYGKGTAKEFRVDKKLHFINKSDVARIVDKNSYSDKEYKEVIKAIASSLIKEKSVAIPNTNYTKYENSKVKEIVKSAVKEAVSKEVKKPQIKTDEQSRKNVPKEMLDLFSMVKQEVEKNSKENTSTEKNSTENDFTKKYKASSNKHKSSLKGYNFDKRVSDAGQTAKIVEDIKNVVKESKEVEKKQVAKAEKELKNVEKLKKEVVKTSDSKTQSKLDKIEEKIIDSVKGIQNVSSGNTKKTRKPRNIYNVLNAGTYEVHDVSLSVKKNMMFDNEENLIEFLGLGQSFFSKAKSNYPNMFSEVTNKKNLKELDKKNIKVSLIEPKIMRERAREAAKKAAEEFKNKQDQEKEALDNAVKTVGEVKDDNVSKAKVFASNDMHKEVKPSTSGENSYKIPGKEKTKYLLQKGEYKFQGYKLNVSKDLYFDTQKDLGYYIEQKFGKSHNIEKVTKNSLSIFFKERIKGFGDSSLLDYEAGISLSYDETKTRKKKDKLESNMNPAIEKIKSLEEEKLPSQKEVEQQIKEEVKNKKTQSQKIQDQLSLLETQDEPVKESIKKEKKTSKTKKKAGESINKNEVEYVKTIDDYIKEIESTNDSSVVDNTSSDLNKKTAVNNNTSKKEEELIHHIMRHREASLSDKIKNINILKKEESSGQMQLFNMLVSDDKSVNELSNNIDNVNNEIQQDNLKYVKTLEQYAEEIKSNKDLLDKNIQQNKSTTTELNHHNINKLDSKLINKIKNNATKKIKKLIVPDREEVNTYEENISLMIDQSLKDGGYNNAKVLDSIVKSKNSKLEKSDSEDVLNHELKDKVNIKPSNSEMFKRKKVVTKGSYDLGDGRIMNIPHDMFIDNEKVFKQYIKDQIGDKNSNKITKMAVRNVRTKHNSDFNPAKIKIEEAVSDMYTLKRGNYEFDGVQNSKVMAIKKDMHFKNKKDIRDYIESNVYGDVKNGINFISDRDRKYIDEILNLRRSPIKIDDRNIDYGSSASFEKLPDSKHTVRIPDGSNTRYLPAIIENNISDNLKREEERIKKLENQIKNERVSDDVIILPYKNNLKNIESTSDGIRYNQETGEIIHDSNKIYQIEAERKLLKDILEIEEKIFELNKKATLEKKQYVDIITDEKSTDGEKLDAMSKMKGVDREYQEKIELLNAAKNAKKDEVNVSNKIVRNTIIEKLKNKNLSEEKIDTIMDYIYNPHKIEGLRYTARKGINVQQSYGGGSGGSGGNGGGRAFMGSNGEMIYGLSGNGDNSSIGGAISNAMTTVGRMRTLMSHVEMFTSYVKDLSRIEEAIFDLGVVGQKSIPEIRQMRDSFLNMATTSRYSVTQLSQAAADIVRVGYDYESSMQILKSGETLATASFEGNLRDSTGTLIKAMTAFQLSANSAAHAANSFHNIVNATPLDLKTFDDSLRQTAAAFGSIVTFSSKSGEELEEYKKQVVDTTAVLTGLQSMLGRTGAQAGTTLKQFATKLIAPQPEATAKFNAELRQKGINYSAAQLATDVKENLDKGLTKLAELYDTGVTSYDTLSKMVG